ncbi:MAG: ribonuclease H-like domain-containing protein [Synergistaceae bacterium]|jgi:uncharacterized protein YprB with RNaseH-like and TPR domain|nr:ribonuclease H-like domain-containing protein [Synergistaceae bacterium]
MGRFDRFFDDDGSLKLGRTPERAPSPVRGLTGGDWADDGVYRMERVYSLGARHGRSVLDRPEDMEVMSSFGARGSVVFLDLETTGLSGGAGTYAFLCGLGIADSGSFKVIQFFLEGPSKELRWLRAIESAIPRDACLATYNGKAFDIPLLRTRHILARSEPSWDRLPHIDLLRHARRFYSGRFESCSLGSMEKNILGVARSDEDIPGYLIPAMYMRYLQTRDARPLNGVFYHNALDIVSLATLYCHVARVLEGASSDGLELIRAGDLWMAIGHPERAQKLWGAAGGFPQSRVEAAIRKGFSAKRARDYESAREEFLRALEAVKSGASCGGAIVYTLLEELAKLEEHRFKSPETAMEHAKGAIEWLRKNRYLLGRSFIQMNRSMAQRAARLEKILEKNAADIV